MAQRGGGLAARSPSNLSEAVDGSPPFFPSLTAQGGMKDERQAAAVGPDPLMGSRGGARCDAIPDPTAGCSAPCWAPHPAQGFRGNHNVPKARGAQEPNKQLLVGKLQNILGKEQPLPPPFSPQRELHVPTALAFVNGTTASRSAPALTSTYCCRKIIVKKKKDFAVKEQIIQLPAGATEQPAAPPGRPFFWGAAFRLLFPQKTLQKVLRAPRRWQILGVQSPSRARGGPGVPPAPLQHPGEQAGSTAASSQGLPSFYFPEGPPKEEADRKGGFRGAGSKGARAKRDPNPKSTPTPQK